MSHQWLAALGAVAVGLLASASLVGQTQTTATPGKNVKKTVPAKAWTASRTPDGQPDLQGNWANNGATPLERPAVLAGRALLTDQEVTELKQRAARLFSNPDSDYAAGDNAFLALLANPDQYKNPGATEKAFGMVEREIDNRTSLIVAPLDGKIPFTSEGQRGQAAYLAARARPAPTDPENLPNDLRCITFGVPRLGAGYNSYYQIVQTPGYVVLSGEVIHDARVIPLDGRPHLPSSVHLWNGDSRGRWEGNTLVVDTINFSSKSYFMGSTENLHLVESFTRSAEDIINYEVTVSDPGVWTAPWTAVIHLKQTKDQIYEYACHEGNYYIMIGMLAGANVGR